MTIIPKEKYESNLTCEQKYDRMPLPIVVGSEKYSKEYKNRFIISCECEKEAESFMAIARFTSGTDLAKVKSDMIESCIKRKTNPNEPKPKQSKEEKSNIDNQTVALVLGVLVVAYFLTK